MLIVDLRFRYSYNSAIRPNVKHKEIFFSVVYSLSNSRRHSANADVIADVKSKIIESRRHFFADVIFFTTWKVQNYQNKTGKNPNIQTNTYLLHISSNFKDIFKYICAFTSANCKQLRKWNRLYRSSLFAVFLKVDIRSNQFRVDLII